MSTTRSLLGQALAKAIDELAQAPSSLGVALSGGADSAMMAVHAAAFARDRSLALHFFHIHHGLQESATSWRGHVHDLALRLRVPCHSRRIRLETAKPRGIEAAARDARYGALAELAHEVGVEYMLLAHHRDDQAETVLLRLLRGAGPTGLASMSPVMRRDGITYLRPWLDVDRSFILECAREFTRQSNWRPVEDPSNADDAYTRSAVRERLTPELNERWPGWQAVLSRHARQSAELCEILSEVAKDDLARLDPSVDGRSFSLRAWRELPAARQALVLRHWLARFCAHLPTDARLQELMRQLRRLHALGHDRQMQLKHGSIWIRCVRGRVLVDSGEIRDR